MTYTEMAILKLKKEDEILRLELEVLELEMKMNGRNKSKKIEVIQRKRGEKCFERAILEQSLQQEQENKIA